MYLLLIRFKNYAMVLTSAAHILKLERYRDDQHGPCARMTCKFVKRSISFKILSDINHSRILYDPPPRILEIKAKINKWDLIKIKSFCTTKETLSKVKRQPSEWEKIIANEATDKQLISKIYKQLMQLNSRKINDPIKKMGQRTKQTFLQRRHTDG